MKKFCLFVSILFIGGLFFANAADMIILKDGNVIEAKIMEMHPNEIRYKRADNLNGPMVFLPKNGVLSIRYENGVVELINAPPSSPAAVPPSAGQASGQTAGAGSSGGQQMGVQALLQTSLLNTLNSLPAIKIAGNNLKFQFGGDNWTALLNGESFSTGTIEVEDADGGSILTLKQTHIWPGAAGKKVGKLASKVPGGAAVGGALNVAGSLAGAVEMSGPVIVLEYKAGPPAKLSYLRSASVASGTPGVLSEPVSIVLADAQWHRSVHATDDPTRKITTAQFKIDNEEIGGQVREVLTMETDLKGIGWKMGTFTSSSGTMMQTLREGSGVRFKVLGDDGKKWILLVGTEEAHKEGGSHYGIPIAPKKGKVIEMDVPYSKLKPIWSRKVPFIKSSILWLQFLREGNNGGSGGISTLKVFDFEIY